MAEIFQEVLQEDLKLLLSFDGLERDIKNHYPDLYNKKFSWKILF